MYYILSDKYVLFHLYACDTCSMPLIDFCVNNDLWCSMFCQVMKGIIIKIWAHSLHYQTLQLMEALPIHQVKGDNCYCIWALVD